MASLDPHQRPPERIRNVYKKYQKMKLQDLDQDQEIVDLDVDLQESERAKISTIHELDPNTVNAAFGKFGGRHKGQQFPQKPVPVYEHHNMPGLQIISNLLLPEIQHILLSRLLHRDLSNPTHLTNIHTHYDLHYHSSSSSSSLTGSFFSIPPSRPTPIARPLDPNIHKPFTIAQLLNKKIRWTTLGGQYDWTAKRYPSSAPPPFPPDIKHLLETLFPSTKSEAAIVNLYSPGDTLSVHRDVAETSNSPLISVSLGCDAIFIIGTEVGGEESVIPVRLKSGSAVIMSGASRFAWHGVPQIVAGTCPEYLADWPAGSERDVGVDMEDGEGRFEAWRGWMKTKRVNLNVRQMFDG